MNNTVIRTEKLTKKYGNIYGIQDLDLVVERGEIFGFLGPNGAGKTTTIRMMVHLLYPSEGEVWILGKRVSDYAYEILKRTSYLPGEFHPFSELTGAEYIRLATRFKDRQVDNIPDLVRRLELTEDVLKRRIKFYSRGMKQKLGLIQSFAYWPELIIMDEPTSGLDPLMQVVFHKLVKEAAGRGSTVFLSSHQLSEVEKICERVAIVRSGRLVSLESLESLRKKRYKKLHLILEHPGVEVSIPESIVKHRDGCSVTLLTRASAREIISALSDVALVDFYLLEPDLEEVFMSYYQKEGGDE